MPRSRLAIILTIAALLLAWGATALAENVIYSCDAPRTGGAPFVYLWYVCWPDSNTPKFYKASRWRMIGVEPTQPGQRMRVRAIDAQGRLGPLSVASQPWQPAGKGTSPESAPQARLLPNYPNPFNPRTTIAFSLPEAGRVRLDIYDVAGKLVRALVDADVPGGVSRIAWDGTDASGRRPPEPTSAAWSRGT